MNQHLNYNPEEIFNDRIKHAAEQIKVLGRKSVTYSTIRVILFLTSLVGLIYFANEREATVVALIVIFFTIAFLILVKSHNKINFALQHQKFINNINREELDRLSGNLLDLDEGEEFFDESHPYTADLDIFGRNSLFQLISRSRTEGSRRMLAGWFMNSPKNLIPLRQRAVSELKHDLEWRQDLQAFGMHFESKDNDIQACLDWLEEEDQLSGNWFLRIAGLVMPVLNVLAIFFFFTDQVSYIVPLGILGITAAIFSKANKEIGDTFKKTGSTVQVLKAYENMIEMIENRDFDSEFLSSIKQDFDNSTVKASASIRKLRSIFNALETRNNMLYLIVDVMLMLDVYWVLRAEKWRRDHKTFASTWFDSIHKLECINSLSGFSYANPEFPFPEIVKDEILETEQIGHPLIPVSERVTNDFKIRTDQRIGIVTGSNMSGKSTFLRTIGINLVLAYAGAPVSAKSLKSGNFRLFTGMRTHDSLYDHVSSFYAELRRLKALIELLENGEPVFFMLDEILKGTNSQDRHKGAKSLIFQLLELNCKGLVSTHDLELSEVESMTEGVFNLSFNSRLENDEVIFDYKIENGVCHSFNATQLMEKMGIKIRE